MKGKRFDVKQFLGKNSVPVLFIIICAVLIPVSGLPVSYILNEAMTRLGRNAFLILSLLIPIMAGMGLNFAMTLGAMAGEIALIWWRTGRSGVSPVWCSQPFCPSPCPFCWVLCAAAS